MDDEIRNQYQKAHQFFVEQKINDSYRILSELISQYPNVSPDFYTLRAAIYQIKNDLHKALADLTKSVELPGGDTLNYQWNRIKIMNQINTPEMLQQVEQIASKLIKRFPDWFDGYIMLIQYYLIDVTLEKYITARNIFKQLILQPIKDQEQRKAVQELCFVIGRMNIHFWFQENTYFILHGIALDLTPEEQVKNRLRKTIDSPLVWTPEDALFVEFITNQCLKLNHPEIPLFAFLQVDCFPLNQTDILKMRVINERNLDMIIQIYQSKNIHFDKIEHLVVAIPQALTYYYAYHNLSNANLFTRINNFYRKLCPELCYYSSWLNQQGLPNNKKDIWTPTCGRKIRIAFLSKYLGLAHSVLRDRSGIIMNLYHGSKNELDIVYYTFDKPDQLSQNMSSQMKDSHFILPKNIYEQQKVLSDGKYDALVFCEIGMDMNTYFLSFGRYAPLQVNTWGHSDTSGQQSVDYFYSSKWYDDETAQKNYSEKIVRMNSLCTFYQDPLDWIGNYHWKTREEYGFSRENHIYYCGQSIFKQSPEFDNVIYDILTKDPYAILLVVDSYGLRNMLIDTRWKNKFGYHMGRIHFLNKIPFAEFLNYIKISDVCLDTYPFGGCNSSLEAFRLGKIVITMPSTMLNGRFTYGFYNKMNITEPIVNSFTEYVEKALYYGNNQMARIEMENKIKKCHSVLFFEQDSITEWKTQLIHDYLERTKIERYESIE